MNRPTPASVPSPKDCVRAYPASSPDWVELVGFDSQGIVRIKIELPRSENLDDWHVWVLRWVRRRDPNARPNLKLMG